MSPHRPLEVLLEDIRGCQICDSSLVLVPRPVVQVGRSAKILIVGQALGRRVRESEVPFDDPSGDRVLDLGEDRLEAFETLFVYRLADVIAAGFEVVPTYRSPHVTITFYDDLNAGIARLLAVSHRIVSNPAFRQEDA